MALHRVRNHKHLLLVSTAFGDDIAQAGGRKITCLGGE